MSDKNKNILEYKGYYGKIEYDSEDEVLYGKIEFINDLVTFEAEDIKGIKQAFFDAVDDYLDICERYNKQPNKSFKGSFNVRISPSLHRNISIAALQNGMNMNQFVEMALENAVENHDVHNEHNMMMEQINKVNYSVECACKDIWDIKHHSNIISYGTDVVKENINA